MKLPTITKDMYAMLVVYLDQSAIQELLETDLANGDITVVDSNEEIVYTTNQEVASYCNANIDHISSESVTKIYLNEGGEYNIVKAYSDVIGWTYIISYDFQIVRDGGVNILLSILVVLCTALFLFFFVLLVTRRIYLPVSNLTQYVGSLVKSNDDTVYEFDYLQTSIHQLADDKANLESLVVSQQPQLVELFQMRLLRSDMKDEKILYYLNRLNIVPKTYLAIVALNIKSQTSEENYDEASQDAIRIDLADHFPQDIEKYLLMPPICNVRAIFFTVSEDEVELLEQKVMLVYQMLDQHVQATYQMSINVGISTPFNDFVQFRDAYNQSIEALKNNEVLHNENLEHLKSGMMFYHDMLPEQTAYQYQNFLEIELREAVDNCEKDRAFEVVNQLLDAMVENNVSSSELYLYLHRLLIAMMLVATDAGVSVNHIFGNHDRNIFLKFNQLYDMDKIRSFYKFKVIVPIIEELSKFRTSKSAIIMKNIQKLVEERKGDITLTECAQQLNYHPTYIWKIMKMERNTTFSDFVAEYKVAEAKRLLKTTKMSVADIAKLLNYTNTQNFIRFFSKKEGITPGKFRTAYKE